MTEIKQPKIRFKGFTDDWEQRKLREVLDVSKEKNTSNSYTKEQVLSVSREAGTVNQIEYQGRSFAGADISGYKVVYPGQLIYTKSPLKDAPFGIFQIVTEEGIVSPLYAVYNSTEHVLASFVGLHLKSDNVATHYLSPLISKGAKNTINITDIGVLDGYISHPITEEQVKIGEFFKTLDDTIALHQQKLEVTKQFKQTMLKKMFPKNGETTPEIRFKGFTDDWENEKFLDICSVKKGTQLNKDTLSREKTETFKYPVYNGSINPIGYTTEYNKEKGLIMTEGGDVGRVLFSETPFWSSGHSYNITSGDNNIYYLQYLFEYNYGKINSKGLGVTIKNLSLSSLKQIILTVSSSYQEQELIGNHFKELDNQIKSLEQKLETYKEFKKAMLQKMFI